jgi:hypothetical protein
MTKMVATTGSTGAGTSDSKAQPQQASSLDSDFVRDLYTTNGGQIDQEALHRLREVRG